LNIALGWQKIEEEEDVRLVLDKSVFCRNARRDQASFGMEVSFNIPKHRVIEKFKYLQNKGTFSGISS